MPKIKLKQVDQIWRKSVSDAQTSFKRLSSTLGRLLLGPDSLVLVFGTGNTSSVLF